MIVSTLSLDRAAFYLYWGAELLGIEGSYPENVFILKLNRFLILYECFIGIIPYRSFCNKRKKLKKMTRKKAGLPEKFTGGKNICFTFKDLARFK